MKIIFHAGYYEESWDASTDGLGGTEQCIINISREFADQGHTVFVVGEVNEIEMGKVQYVPLSKSHTIQNPDVIVGVSYLHYLNYYKVNPGTKTIFWLHNELPYYWYRGERMSDQEIQDAYNNTDKVVCLTDWHKKAFLKQETAFVHSNKVAVIGNGINKSLIQPVAEKESGSFVYTSHPERGLENVLSDFDKKYIEGHLHICTPSYGVDYFEAHYRSRVESMDNVTYHGNLPVADLYSLLSRMETWYYPTEYNETYCITALEMLAHHVKPLVNPIAGLAETINGFNSSNPNWDEVDDYIESRWWVNVYNEWRDLMEKDWEPEVDMTYIITLDTNKEQELKNRFASFGLDSAVTIMPGCNGHTGENLPDQYEVCNHWKIEGHENEWWNRNVMPGEAGCALSHIQVWKDAYNKGYKKILILEEDFEVLNKFNSDLLKTDYDWTLFYLGCNFPEEPKPISEHHVIPRLTYCTHSYMLTREGCRLLLEQEFGHYVFAVDEFLSATFSEHPRGDLNYITRDTRAIALKKEYHMFKQKDQETKVHKVYDYTKELLRNIPYNEFVERFLTYSARLREYDLIVDEPFEDVYTFPLFTEEFCKLLIQEANDSNKWTKKRHDYYPATDMLITELGLQWYYQRILKEYVYPVAIHMWHLEGKGWDVMNSENFIIKYEETVQGHLSLHHDYADISCVLALNEGYEGGGTYFSKQRKLHKGKTGCVSIHPSQITHRHGARPVVKGERYVLVSFCRKPKQ
jgi:GR25 family glycosyltransferase involved in LPS biosynthesis